jgi:hypothetical protein
MRQPIVQSMAHLLGKYDFLVIKCPVEAHDQQYNDRSQKKFTSNTLNFKYFFQTILN